MKTVTNIKSPFKKLIKNPFAWLAFFLILYIIVGFLIIPLVVKSQALKFVKDEYKRDCTIESVSFNPFTFEFTVRGFRLYDKDKSVFLSWGEFYVNLSLFPLLSKRIEIERFRLTHPGVAIKKLNETEFNFSDLLNIYLNQPKDTIPSGENDWEFILRKTELLNGEINLTDKSVNPEFTLQIIKLNIITNDIHVISKDTTSFKVDFQVNRNGVGSLDGIFTLDPVMLNFQYDLATIELKPLETYLLNFAHIEVRAGNINTSGNVKIKMIDSLAIPDISFYGNSSIYDLDFYDTKHKDDLIAWHSLAVRGISVRTHPLSIKIEEINANKLFSRIAISTDQLLNVAQVMKTYEVSVDTTIKDLEVITETKPIDFSFDVGVIKIKDSEMLFSDFSLPLQFIARIHSLNGEITGLSKGNPLGAGVELQGTVDEYGLARIKGRFDPFDLMRYSDIKMNFNNIELTRLTPYSVKFVGYKVEKGKLTLDLEYKIENGQLTAYNKIFLNKLTLGDEIETDEGLGLPIKLAIALLKDGDGNIDLDLEVEGDLNDPQTDTGKLVWWAIKRSLTTIVTAPFRFLGNLFGFSGEDMEYVDFDPGESKLLVNQIEKLDTLTKALNNRPNISLEIYGAIDTVTDANAIRLKKFKSDFTKRMKSTAKDTLVDPMKVEVSTSQGILESMYREAFGDSSLVNLKIKYHGNASTGAASQESIDTKNYFNDMIAELTSIQPVSVEELNILATKRSESIKNYMITKNNIPADRLVIEETEIYELEDRNWVKCKLGIGIHETEEK
jgi:hypothetical protein